MNETVNITGILSRSNEGVTQPFICECDDGEIYFVKGHDAGYTSLRNEWIAGHIAIDFELPIPDFKILYVENDLIKFSTIPSIADLGSGYVFGSKKAGEALTNYNHGIGFCDESIINRLLLFDWWVNNEDRYLCEGHGNVNLLWDYQEESLIVIDHNLAFDEEFNHEIFWEKHVFKRHAEEIFTKQFIIEHEKLLKQSLHCLEDRLSCMPDSWFPLDDQEEYKLKVFNILNRFNTNPLEFWRRLI